MGAWYLSHKIIMGTAAAPLDLLQGTLDLLVLKALAWGPRPGYARRGGPTSAASSRSGSATSAPSARCSAPRSTDRPGARVHSPPPLSPDRSEERRVGKE